MKDIVTGWEKKINLALTEGKGKYGEWTPVGDLFDYKKIIALIRQGKVLKAAEFAQGLDTAAREEIPETIWRVLDKVYYSDD